MSTENRRAGVDSSISDGALILFPKREIDSFRDGDFS